MSRFIRHFGNSIIRMKIKLKFVFYTNLGYNLYYLLRQDLKNNLMLDKFKENFRTVKKKSYSLLNKAVEF